MRFTSLNDWHNPRPVFKIELIVVPSPHAFDLSAFWVLSPRSEVKRCFGFLVEFKKTLLWGWLRTIVWFKWFTRNNSNNMCTIGNVVEVPAIALPPVWCSLYLMHKQRMRLALPQGRTCMFQLVTKSVVLHVPVTDILSASLLHECLITYQFTLRVSR
jgi:hypothetical protein